MKIITVVGTKNTGKTTLVTMIVKELSKRGYKVGTIKHTHPDSDLAGQDTWKHREAGAKIVVGSGKGPFSFINKLLSLKNILKIVSSAENPEYVVIEGFKAANYANISTTSEKDDFTIANIDVLKTRPENVVDLVDLVEARTYSIIR